MVFHKSENSFWKLVVGNVFETLPYLVMACVRLERSYQVDKGFSETKWRLTRFEEKRKVRHSVIYFCQKCYFGPQAADLNLEQTWPGSDEDFFVVSRPTRRSESREQPPILVWSRSGQGQVNTRTSHCLRYCCQIIAANYPSDGTRGIP